MNEDTEQGFREEFAHAWNDIKDSVDSNGVHLRDAVADWWLGKMKWYGRLVLGIEGAAIDKRVVEEARWWSEHISKLFAAHGDDERLLQLAKEHEQRLTDLEI